MSKNWLFASWTTAMGYIIFSYKVIHDVLQMFFACIFKLMIILNKTDVYRIKQTYIDNNKLLLITMQSY